MARVDFFFNLYMKKGERRLYFCCFLQILVSKTARQRNRKRNLKRDAQKKEILVFGVCKLTTKYKNMCILQSSVLLRIEANVTFAINYEILWKPNNMHLNLGTII